MATSDESDTKHIEDLKSLRNLTGYKYSEYFDAKTIPQVSSKFLVIVTRKFCLDVLVAMLYSWWPSFFSQYIIIYIILLLLYRYILASLVRSPTCFKSDSPQCIDLILTNTKSSFQATTTIETGLSDFHTMIVTVLKGGHVKRGPKIISYRDYSQFSTVDFRNHLMHMLSSELGGNEDYGAFKAVVMAVLNEHAPVEKKYIRANGGPFMTKALPKENMHRTRLRNKCKNDSTEENQGFQKAEEQMREIIA